MQSIVIIDFGSGNLHSVAKAVEHVAPGAEVRVSADAAVTLHIDSLRGANAHHVAETVFKAFGRALRMALEEDARMGGVIPSTKGAL